MSIQLEEVAHTQHAVLTVSNLYAMEAEDVQEMQTTGSTHQHCSEETDSSTEGIEASRRSEQALTFTNQLGISTAETDC